MIEVITSVNQQYWDIIGRDSIQSWLQHWSTDFRLTVYVEEFTLPLVSDRIQQIGFQDLDPDYSVLQQESWHPSVRRFAKKAYSFIHAMQHSRSRWIIWLDADVITQQRVNWALWQPLLRKDFLCTYMGVTYTTDKQGNPGHWLVPETGVFAVNQRHSLYQRFRDEYCRRYRERDCQDLRRFYDNDVFGAAVKCLPDAMVNDLCRDLTKHYKTPLKHTVLGPYLSHFKAKHSKFQYASRDSQASAVPDEAARDLAESCDPDPCDDP
mgnify:CR=1 FL=1